MTKVGVVIARFQVPRLHAGHEAVIRAAMAENDSVVVLLGCSDLDGRTAENPLLFLQRKAVVERAFGSNIHILPLQNMKSNRAWSKQVDMAVFALFPGAEARIYVGRDSVVPGCYTGKAKVVEVPSVYVGVSGTEIRRKIKPQNDVSFMNGQVFALQYQYPHAYQCVDIAVLRGVPVDVLLIQRADTGAWCLPGGFVDPTDKSLEDAARRELLEETGLTCEGDLTYVGSTLIDDWRYRGRDKIMSALFAVPLGFGMAGIRTEEVTDYCWYPLSGVGAYKVPVTISSSHAAFIEMLSARFNSQKETV